MFHPLATTKLLCDILLELLSRSVGIMLHPALKKCQKGNTVMLIVCVLATLNIVTIDLYLGLRFF